MKIIITLLFLLLGVSLGQAYVMGPDDRLVEQDAGAQPAAVRQAGMIRIQGEAFVSGLLTGANCDVVISAGHAAFYWEDVPHKRWRKGHLRGLGQFYFSIEPDEPTLWQALKLVASGYQELEQVGEDEHDWSIFRIDVPLVKNCSVIPLSRRTPNCDAGLLMPGFHFDKPGSRLLAGNCEVKQVVDGRLIIHDCDSKDGSSGAPLFCPASDTLRLLGINISGLTKRDYYDAGVYGKSGKAFHAREHKNFAIAVDGDFKRALLKELKASEVRKTSVGE